MFGWSSIVPNKKCDGGSDRVRISTDGVWIDICVMSLVRDRMSVKITSVQIDGRYLVTYSVL